MSPRRTTATTASPAPARRRALSSAAFAVPIILLLSAALFVLSRSAIAAPTSSTRAGLARAKVVVSVGEVGGRFLGGGGGRPSSSGGVGIRPKSSSAAAFVVGCSFGVAPTTAAFSSDWRRSSSAASCAGSATAATVRRTASTLASSLGFSPPPPPEDDEDADADDPLKWERMYEEGERARGAAAASSPRRSSLKGSEVRVVTFDLDNTLWRTGKVITAANDALAEYLSAKGVVTPERTEAVMGELFRRDSARYCPLLAKEMEEEEEIVGANGDGSSAAAVSNVGQSNVYISSDKGHKPVLLTRLRKDAVREICVRHNGYSTSDAERFADDAFDVWTSARHGAIPHHLAESVYDAFERIRALRTSTGDPVVVGAVTDGNSDPRTVPGLGQYFDFVVNAESVGVSKPDRRVYYAAARELASFPALADLFSVKGDDASPTLDSRGKLVLNEDVLEDVIGPWWCHVGDDFIKDCVAAKDLRMRSVWCRELVLPSEEDSNSQKGEAKKKKDVADLVKELAAMKVVEMSIGAEDFLADSIHREFTDAILDRFVDVGETVARWHEEGLRNTATMEAIADVLEVVVPDEPGTGAFDGVVAGAAATAEEVPPSRETTAAETAGTAQVPKRDKKFCMNCGAELPYEAKFCSDCGAKQPVL